MEWKDRYEALVRGIKDWLDKYVGDWQHGVYNLPFDKTGEIAKDLIKLVSELAESEDERIRKELIGHLKACRNNTRSELMIGTYAKWIAYLEKQKEQKSAEWKPLPESMEALLLAIEGEWDAIKPTGYMSRRLEDLYDGLVNTFDIDEKYLGNLPKTEYTEKDIEKIKALKKKIDSSMETKLAEWSEEDEKFIKHCAELLDKQGEPMCALRLESLRPKPHWKPSEEQMDAFRIYLYHPQYIGNSEDIKIKLVESLYNDLKKL